MFGIAPRSVVITCDEAKEYVMLKIESITKEIDTTVNHLNELQDELADEMRKLAALTNPPEL